MEKIMGEFSFNDILSEDEISSLFNDDELDDSQVTQPEQKEKKQKDDDTTEVDVDDIFSDENSSESPESVGSEDDIELEDASSNKNGTSPNNFYSSIAKALSEDSILLNSNDVNFDEIKTAEDLSNLLESEIQNRFDERQKRIDEALNLGVEPTAIQNYERTISYLEGISEDALSDESEKGETLRKQLIYQDFINRGYSKDRAVREVNKSFNAGSDIEDAKESLESNKEFFKGNYNKLIKDARAEEDKRIEDQKKESEALKNSILNDDKVFGDLIVDKASRRKIYDNVSKPVYKDPQTGELYTAIQKYEKDNHTDFIKYVGLIYTLTDGFKNLDGLVKNKVNKEIKKGLKNLENTINTSSRNSDGSYRFVTSSRNEDSDSYSGLGGWVPDVK